MKKVVCVLCATATIGLYSLQPPSWEFTQDISPAVYAYDVVETPTGALLAAIAEWTSGSHAIVYRSTDGGNTWTGVLYPVLFGGSCWDIEVSPTTGRIYAVMNLSNGVEQRMYYSSDDGQTWTELVPRIPLSEGFIGSNDLSRLPMGLKSYNNKVYIWGMTKNDAQGPLFHGEIWWYDELSGNWGKYDLIDLNANQGGWTIETGPGPSPGTYLYLGTYNTGTVIRSNNPVSLSIGKDKKKTK